MRLLLCCFWLVILAPMITHSLEPKNPVDACERFIRESDKKSCLKKTQNKDIDWYASSFCEQIDNDKIFLSCFNLIQKARFEPKAVSLCEKLAGEDEEQKFQCLKSVRNKGLGPCHKADDLVSLASCLRKNSQRMPASPKSFFQN